MVMIPLFILAVEDDDDREFLSELYLKYNRAMYKQIIQVVKDPWATEDILQNVLMTFVEKVRELREKDRPHLTNYILVSCRNRALNYVRDQSAQMEPSLDEEWYTFVASPEDGPELTYIKKENLHRLKQVWPLLDEKTRSLLEAYYVQKKTTEELAQEMGLKPGSVRMAVSRARKTAFAIMEKTPVKKF